MAAYLSTTRIGRRAVLIAGSALATLGRRRPASASRPYSVRFAFFGDPAEEAAYGKLIDAFQSANSDIGIEPIYTPSSTDYAAKLSTSFAAGSPPDVSLISYRRFGQYAARGALEPLGAYLESSAQIAIDDFYEPAVSAFRYNGADLFGIPQNASSLVVYYNVDLFNAAGLESPKDGWSWDEFSAAAKALTRDDDGDGIVEVAGLVVEPSMSRYAAFIWGAGGEVVDDVDHTTTLTVQTPEAVDGIRWFVNLGQTGLKVTPTEAEVLSEDDITRFQSGRAAMLIHSRRVVPTLRQDNSMTWDVAPLPVGKRAANVLHSDAFCMSAASNNKDAAWTFIEFAMGTIGQAILAETGRTVPSLKSVAESDAFLKGSEIGRQFGVESLSMPPVNSRVFIDNVSILKRLPSVSTWPEVESGFETPFKRAFYVEIDLADALEIATYQSRQALQRADG